MKKIMSIVILATVFLVACKSSKNTSGSSASEEAVQKWIVGSEKVSCDNGTDEMCIQIKKGSSPFYEVLSQPIEGFEYEPGYKYLLKVEVNESKKSGTVYTLVEELFKVPMK